jgi:integrase
LQDHPGHCGCCTAAPACETADSKKIGCVFVFALPKNDRERIIPLSDWIPEPKKDRRGRARYATTRREGIHQLRHYYASVMLAGGVSIKELAEYLGHADPAFTLRVYAHLLPSSHDRARTVINDRFGCLMSDPGNRERSRGTETEQA